VARVLFDRPRHHSTAAQIFTQVRANGGGCSRATVYNCLELFTERKLLQQIVVEHGLVFYDTVITPHPHLYNIDTGELRDIDANQPLGQWLPALPADTKLESACLVVRVRNNRSSEGKVPGVVRRSSA
jgi:Fur family iron response transcriptional regulator